MIRFSAYRWLAFKESERGVLGGESDLNACILIAYS